MLVSALLPINIVWKQGVLLPVERVAGGMFQIANISRA